MTRNLWSSSEDKIDRRMKFVAYAAIAALAMLGMIVGMPTQSSDIINPDSTPVSDHVEQRYGRKVHPCGLTGSVRERIADCNETRVTHGGWTWRLVTRANSGNEVWMEPEDTILWGDAISTVEPAMKGQMPYTRSLTACSCDLDENGQLWSMTWNLPTSDDYERANKYGIREVLPNISDEFWTETSYYIPPRVQPWTWDKEPNRASIFRGSDGLIVRDVPERFHRVRCIGRK